MSEVMLCTLSAALPTKDVPTMKIQTADDAPTKQQLRKVLERKFPDYQYSNWGRTLFVHQSLTRGVSIVVSRKKIAVHWGPSSLASMAVLAALFVFVLPGIIYMIVSMQKSGPMIEEIGNFLDKKYGE